MTRYVVNRPFRYKDPVKAPGREPALPDTGVNYSITHTSVVFDKHVWNWFKSNARLRNRTANELLREVMQEHMAKVAAMPAPPEPVKIIAPNALQLTAGKVCFDVPCLAGWVFCYHVTQGIPSLRRMDVNNAWVAVSPEHTRKVVRDVASARARLRNDYNPRTGQVVP